VGRAGSLGTFSTLGAAGNQLFRRTSSPAATSSQMRKIVMQTLSTRDRPSWLSASAWPWPTYSLSDDTGRGLAPLFVHVGSCSFVARRIGASVKPFCCVTLDAPGAGQSERSASAPTLGQAGNAVTAVVDALQLNASRWSPTTSAPARQRPVAFSRMEGPVPGRAAAESATRQTIFRCATTPTWSPRRVQSFRNGRVRSDLCRAGRVGVRKDIR
jgi:hypothetical protein